MQNDYEQYIINYQKKLGTSYVKDAYEAISKDLRGNDKLFAVSDIIGGLSDNKIQGDWGHSLSYWRRNPDLIAIESFAHLFEGQFNEERLKSLSSYFPTATKKFNEILEGLL